MILIKNEIKRNKIWRHIFNDHSRNCFKDDGKDRGRSLYLYVKIELDKEWLYEKIYGFA